MLASHVPSNSTGSASRPSMPAARSDVQGRRCPETRPSTRWSLGADPYRRGVRTAREDGETACAARSKSSSGRLGNAEPVPLACDRDGLHMTTYLFPILLAGPARAGTLVGQAPRFEPAIHVRFTTWNRRAASALLPPPQTKSTTRWRKSLEHLISQDHTSIISSHQQTFRIAWCRWQRAKAQRNLEVEA